MEAPICACAFATILAACSAAAPPDEELGRPLTTPLQDCRPIRAWAYDATTTIFRQSICTHFEAPFVVLLVGEKRALLIDTGTGDVDVRGSVDQALTGKDLDLVVAHSHAHGDHVGGDAQFADRPRTTTIGSSPAEVADAFGFVANAGRVDLGGRIVDVIAIPGHESSHVAFYDRTTRVLFTGDTLYPGRLYVRDWPAYRASVARLVAFIDAGNPVRHVIGAHIELSSTNVEYPVGATSHPNEHPLALTEGHLRDLLATVESMGDAPVRVKRPSYVVVPLR